ncbi:MAG: hypothetical protein Tsb0019_30830 [Roseibium sp.]
MRSASDIRLGDPHAASEQERLDRLTEILTGIPHIMTILRGTRDLALPGMPGWSPAASTRLSGTS